MEFPLVDPISDGLCPHGNGSVVSKETATTSLSFLVSRSIAVIPNGIVGIHPCPAVLGLVYSSQVTCSSACRDRSRDVKSSMGLVAQALWC